jgi:hypothetical protein
MADCVDGRLFDSSGLMSTITPANATARIQLFAVLDGYSDKQKPVLRDLQWTSSTTM